MTTAGSASVDTAMLLGDPAATCHHHVKQLRASARLSGARAVAGVDGEQTCSSPGGHYSHLTAELQSSRSSDFVQQPDQLQERKLIPYTYSPTLLKDPTPKTNRFSRFKSSNKGTLNR